MPTTATERYEVVQGVEGSSSLLPNQIDPRGITHQPLHAAITRFNDVIAGKISEAALLHAEMQLHPERFVNGTRVPDGTEAPTPPPTQYSPTAPPTVLNGGGYGGNITDGSNISDGGGGYGYG